MKENLSVQFLYPATKIPDVLVPIIERVDHVKITPSSTKDKNLLSKSDIIVYDHIPTSVSEHGKPIVIRTDFNNLLKSGNELKGLLRELSRISVVITDVERFSRDDIDAYKDFLDNLASIIEAEINKGQEIQLNLLSDRMMLKDMNNCGSGHESVTVSLNGTLYPCPAFVDIPEFKCGDIINGINENEIKLYYRKNAPICRICDAYQCRRCIWLNHSLTHEVNTPGWQQCVMAHIEREASRKLLNSIRNSNPTFLKGIEIPEIDYLDPISKIDRL